MKTLVTTIFLSTFTLFSYTQITNGGFENWTIDTIVNGAVAGGDIIFEDPDDWSTANYLTEDPTFGGFAQVAKDLNSNTGNYSVMLQTKTINVFGNTVNVPGVTTNGTMNINLLDLINDGIDLQEVITGGKPIGTNTHPATLDGFYTYRPVGTDTFAVVISLTRWDAQTNSQEQVGGGFYQSDSPDTVFSAFQVPLTYISCNDPDSALIVIVSSNGQNGSDGTVLNIDDLSFNGTAVGIAPTVASDSVGTSEGYTVNIDVLANDSDCDGSIASVSIIDQPSNGTAVVEANKTITYTPNTGYTGPDALIYEACDNDNLCNPFGFVTIQVDPLSSGIASMVSPIIEKPIIMPHFF